MLRIVTLAILISLLGATGVRAQAFPGQQSLPPAELDEQRGGFDLPGGMSVALGVTTQTAVDGREVFRTVFNLQGATPTLTTLVNTGHGLVVAPINGGSVAPTALGNVRVSADGSRVELVGADLRVSHLVGGAFGSIVANSGNDRAIDVTTTVDIAVSGVRPELLGNSLSAVSNIAAESAARLVR